MLDNTLQVGGLGAFTLGHNCGRGLDFESCVRVFTSTPTHATKLDLVTKRAQTVDVDERVDGRLEQEEVEKDAVDALREHLMQRVNYIAHIERQPAHAESDEDEDGGLAGSDVLSLSLLAVSAHSAVLRPYGLAVPYGEVNSHEATHCHEQFHQMKAQGCQGVGEVNTGCGRS